MGKLIGIYFLNALKLNELSHGPNRAKMRGFLAVMILVAASLIFTVGSYSYFMGSALMSIGAADIMPAVFMTVACLIIFISVLFTTKGILFGFKDFDIQMSLPVSTGKIVASRIAILYIFEFLYALIIMLPSMAVYAYLTKPDALFYPLAIVSVILIPVIPIIVGAIFGTLFALIASRFRRTSAARIILLLLFTFAIMAMSFSMNNQISPETAGLIENFMNSLAAKYPPVRVFSLGIGGDIAAFIAFVVISVLLFLLFSLFVGKFFKRLNTVVTAIHTKGNFRLTEVRASSAQAALFFKEIKTYFNSALYVLNTSFGLIILLIASVAALIMGIEKVMKLVNVPISPDQIAPVLPLAISLIVCMSSTSCSSISMEGVRFWIIRTLPVSPAQVFKAKMGVNLAITVPVVILSALAFSVVLKPPLDITLFMFITPFIYCLFISAVGLIINLFAPKLEWKNEAAVIKQSAAVLVTMLIGFVVSGIPLYFMITSGGTMVLLVTTLAAALLTALCYVYLFAFGGKKFASLG
jgi:ABC-2 type transport system permease protein